MSVGEESRGSIGWADGGAARLERIERGMMSLSLEGERVPTDGESLQGEQTSSQGKVVEKQMYENFWGGAKKTKNKTRNGSFASHTVWIVY